MTREQKIAQMRTWIHTVAEANGMIAATLRNNKVATIEDLATKHPKQFNSLYVAIEVMETEMPEPAFPWPSA